MGADLYIRKVYEANHAKYRPIFDAACIARDTAFPRDVPVERGTEKFKTLQAAVNDAFEKMNSEGYFRDSYNSSSVMAQMGLSWWRDVIPLQNKKGELRSPSIKKLIAMIEAHPITRESVQEAWDKQAKDFGRNPEESVDEWLEYFTKDRAALLAFLRKALELKEPIDASL